MFGKAPEWFPEKCDVLARADLDESVTGVRANLRTLDVDNFL